jgi:pimeloyl-ACP methyl ester carboxylesterase
MQAPFYPIVYVRGYAMTEGERDETAADPFCGFNLGSTVYRSSIGRDVPPKKFIFESPLVRLGSEFGYADVYEEGRDITDPEWKPPGTDDEGKPLEGIPARSVVVYRYYDAGSGLLGSGKASDIRVYAEGLSRLIARVRDLVVLREKIPPADFRCHLVAHSMGGLVARAMLQNPQLDPKQARGLVDKFFTYATPHNGIEVFGANVPAWLNLAEIDTFSRKEMAKYLKLESVFAAHGRVDYLPEDAFPLERTMCMIGTNRLDYQAAMGLSRTFAGNGSDGLVKVANAGLWGVKKDGSVSGTAATAFCYRAHSGYFGIVNSEEAYQNLVRFLFGDVRVDIWIEVERVDLPAGLEGQKVEALYQFELLARPRGKRWALSRRMAEEDSPACRTHSQLVDPGATASRWVYLSTVFLANRAKISNDKTDRTLSYAMDLGVRVPDYEVDKKFWPNQHYEGSYLFKDQLTLVMTPPADDAPAAEALKWRLDWGWLSQGTTSAANTGHSLVTTHADMVGAGRLQVKVPFRSPATQPAIRGQVVLQASAWNAG